MKNVLMGKLRGRQGDITVMWDNVCKPKKYGGLNAKYLSCGTQHQWGEIIVADS